MNVKEGLSCIADGFFAWSELAVEVVEEVVIAAGRLHRPPSEWIWRCPVCMRELRRDPYAPPPLKYGKGKTHRAAS